MAAVASKAGCDGRDAAGDDVKAEYRRYTEEAIGRGVFGSPFYFFEGERFWGQDRLEHLERAIEKARWAKKQRRSQPSGVPELPIIIAAWCSSAIRRQDTRPPFGRT